MHRPAGHVNSSAWPDNKSSSFFVAAPAEDLTWAGALVGVAAFFYPFEIKINTPMAPQR